MRRIQFYFVTATFVLLFVTGGCDDRNAMKSSGDEEATVKVYLNPLIVLLAGAERQQGRPLTQDEVLKIRDTAVSTMMTPGQATKFYKSLDSQVPVHRMNPDRIWEEWREIRNDIVF